MLFNSILFLAFFAFVYVIYWNLRGKSRQVFLLLASIAFYAVWGLQKEGWWGLRWTLHFLGMAGFNYVLTRLMFRNPDSLKPIATIAVIINLLNLGIFKYFDFLRRILLDLGVSLPREATEFSLFLPLAISFYTF